MMSFYLTFFFNNKKTQKNTKNNILKNTKNNIKKIILTIFYYI